MIKQELIAKRKAKKVKLLKINVYQCCLISQKNSRVTFTSDIRCWSRPACLVGEKLDPDCLPPIESTDLLSFLVLETSFYTLKQFKAYKSLDSYDYMVSGL